MGPVDVLPLEVEGFGPPGAAEGHQPEVVGKLPPVFQGLAVNSGSEGGLAQRLKLTEGHEVPLPVPKVDLLVVDGALAPGVEHLEERNGFTSRGRPGMVCVLDRLAGLASAFCALHGLPVAQRVTPGESERG